MRDSVAPKGEKYYFVIISSYLRTGEAQDIIISMLSVVVYIMVYLWTFIGLFSMQACTFLKFW